MLSSRVRTGRSIRGLSLPPACSRAERREVERVVAEGLSGLSGELAGKYYRLSDMTEKEQQQLIDVSEDGPDPAGKQRRGAAGARRRQRSSQPGERQGLRPSPSQRSSSPGLPVGEGGREEERGGGKERGTEGGRKREGEERRVGGREGARESRSLVSKGRPPGWVSEVSVSEAQSGTCQNSWTSPIF